MFLTKLLFTCDLYDVRDQLTHQVKCHVYMYVVTSTTVTLTKILKFDTTRLFIM